MSKEIANRIGAAFLLVVFLVLSAAILANTANNNPRVLTRQQIPQGDPVRGAGAIYEYGCGTCHQIPGISGADGMVGPTLANLSERSILAGQLPNTPDNLIMWIQHPQTVRPGNDMPDMGISEADARNIATYLYSLPQKRFTNFGQ
jgi:cytochrome c